MESGADVWFGAVTWVHVTGGWCGGGGVLAGDGDCSCDVTLDVSVGGQFRRRGGRRGIVEQVDGSGRRERAPSLPIPVRVYASSGQSFFL